MAWRQIASFESSLVSFYSVLSLLLLGFFSASSRLLLRFLANSSHFPRTALSLSRLSIYSSLSARLIALSLRSFDRSLVGSLAGRRSLAARKMMPNNSHYLGNGINMRHTFLPVPPSSISRISGLVSHDAESSSYESSEAYVLYQRRRRTLTVHTN